MKVAIYARVSTRKGEEKQTTENQLRELKAYCERQGWTDIQIIEDDLSGKKSTRPGLQQIMELARLKKIDVVLVWKIDRFARSMKDFVLTVLQLDTYGVRFLAMSQNIDTDQQNPTSKLLMHILAAMAEFESSLISERVKSGIQRVKAEGKEWGRPKRIFDREKARQLRAEGLSWAKVAEHFPGVSTGAIRRGLAESLPPSAKSQTAGYVDVILGREP